jgi:hypothetical protein
MNIRIIVSGDKQRIRCFRSAFEYRYGKLSVFVKIRKQYGYMMILPQRGISPFTAYRREVHMAALPDGEPVQQ